MTLKEIATKTGPKKLLSLDGGGIRGIITLEILAKIEDTLRAQCPAEQQESFVLADYFDYIAGTSTGAILAAGLSLGMSVKDLDAFYEKCGPDMFERSSLLRRLRYRYQDEPLAEKLKEVYGKDTDFGHSSQFKTLLMMVLRNATTDSPWPVSNNPQAKYNAPDHPDCNAKLPLWQLVRGSTAAPTYFPPEQIFLGEREFLFVDGGITMFNNPAWQLFLMATLKPYKLEWPTGEKEMLIVSLGTGYSEEANTDLTPRDMNILYNAGSIPSALMFAALQQQDMNCRIFGECLVGEPIDREIGDLVGDSAPGNTPKLFTYLRYNNDISQKGLNDLGLDDIRSEEVSKLDSIEAIPDLRRVGKKISERVQQEHFTGFPI